MPDDPLATVEHQITEALAELREARTRYDHSPNVDSEYWVQQAQTRLDMLQDRRSRIKAAEVVAEEMVR
jgi:hypothetical protein